MPPSGYPGRHGNGHCAVPADKHRLLCGTGSTDNAGVGSCGGGKGVRKNAMLRVLDLSLGMVVRIMNESLAHEARA